MVAIESYSAWEEGTITHTPIQDGRLLESTIESNWLSVKVLKLKGYHVAWTSKAYHGLTEPRLIYPQLGGSSLLSVLKSSPQIRVLELDVKLKDDFDDEPPPIQFDDLEQLVLRLDHSELSQSPTTTCAWFEAAQFITP
ncbi:hypothetical protein OPQ81_008542 [Rhizoctonia solani]|nr:hypothetical protein OPQ81_008542 [Rhizoctonia solani]